MLVTIFSVTWDWLPIDQKCREVFLNIVFSGSSITCLSITTNLMSFFNGSIWSFLLEWEYLIRKFLKVYLSVEVWWTKIARKCFSSWHTSVFKLILLQLYLSHFFHQGVNLDSFIPEKDCSFLNILRNGLYIRIGILTGQKRQKCF